MQDETLQKADEEVVNIFKAHFKDATDEEVQAFISDANDQIGFETFLEALYKIEELDKTENKILFTEAKDILENFSIEKVIRFQEICNELSIDLDQIQSEVAEDVLSEVLHDSE
jgi:hypothetical protein